MINEADNIEALNLSDFIPDIAQRRPDKQAILFPTGYDINSKINYKRLTFSELENEIK